MFSDQCARTPPQGCVVERIRYSSLSERGCMPPVLRGPRTGLFHSSHSSKTAKAASPTATRLKARTHIRRTAVRAHS